jgi:hypothetical protein
MKDDDRVSHVCMDYIMKKDTRTKSLKSSDPGAARESITRKVPCPQGRQLYADKGEVLGLIG